jgi:DNA-binding Lrp family transcriptional regulator
MRKPDLDELDHQLIDILAQDARVSNRKIASELGVNEGTVRG